MASRSQTTVKQTPQARRPGRPRRFDSNQVLDSALELFWKQGFANTTTRHLETSLSLNQSSIYNTFGSKEQLFEMALDRYEGLATEALLKPLETSDKGIAALEQFYNSLYKWITEDGRRGCMLINMMAEDGGKNFSITTRTKAYRQRVKQGLATAIDRAIKTGDLSEGDTDSRSLILLGLALGINIAARGGASDDELKSLVKAVKFQIQNWRVASN